MPRRTSRYDKRDQNERDIVKALLEIPGVSVQEGHDDLLIGHKGVNYWVEVKNPSEVDKSGRPYAKKSKSAKKQAEISETWKGQYDIVTTLEQILVIIGVIR